MSNRRDFLKKAGGLALLTIVPRSVLGGTKFVAPSDQLTKGIIGVGGIGKSSYHFTSNDACRLVAVCDVDSKHLQSALDLGKKRFNETLQSYRDFRRLIADRIREFDVSSATVELAAVAVGVEGARIAKSMSFKLADDAPIIIVTAGDRKIDSAKYKAYFHVKAKMLTFDEACAFTGHAPGGVCSFALPENVKTYLDVSLKRFDTVFPAAGSANSAIEMTCDELEKYSSNFVAWVDVCKEKAPAPQA